MVLYGASGHAKVVIEALIASGISISGVYDDNESIKNILDIAVLGKYRPEVLPEQPRIITVGSNITRKKIVQRLDCRFGKAIHPRASISPTVLVGDGSVVMDGVVINADSKIGRHVILNTSCSIDHDSFLEDFVHISPGATLCGGVRVGEGTQVGAGTTVIQNITIGKWVTIGAGSVVIENLPDFAVAVGVPARVIKFNEQYV